jgi:hypothetical protein
VTLARDEARADQGRPLNGLLFALARERDFLIGGF